MDTSQYYLDHICYRVETIDRYKELKEALLDHTQLLNETIINGRPIASYRLKEPFHYKNRVIDCLELPSPKPGSFYPEGYEHVEFVIQDSFEDFMKRFPQATFTTKGLQKKINADISIKFEENLAVKFHHHPLRYVIEHLDQDKKTGTARF